MWSIPTRFGADTRTRRLRGWLDRIGALWLLGGLLAAATACASSGPSAEESGAGAEAKIATAAGPIDANFGRWLNELRAEARGRGIKPATLDAALKGVQPIPRVIELDRKQPEATLTFEEYLGRVVPDGRVEKGRERLRENAALLRAVERRFGVEPEVIVALWGIESDFGGRMGGFPVIDALATLAYDGRRSAYFRGELLDALTIVDQGHVEPAAMLGSWAGAMGQAQFMPSSFLGYAVDFDGDGRRDIWATQGDVFASAANYLATIGWTHGQAVAEQVLLPADLDAEKMAGDEPRPLSDWRAAGVMTERGEPLPAAENSRRATLVLPNGGRSPAYLAYDNFRVILKWNRSNYFALAVAQLADRIRNR